ncbi:MAG TPA: hypothetical protein VFH77_08475 [Streptomyces sp.]|nr:hypothetical protein [Streptomyces sp.]
MIGYLLLSAGVIGTAACGYYVAPAGRGAHRYLVPRSVLRAEAVCLQVENEQMARTVIKLTSEVALADKAHDAAQESLSEARTRIRVLEEQLAELDVLRAENTRLRADLDNVRAVRPLTAAADEAPTVPGGIPVMPLQQAPLAADAPPAD